MRMQRGSGSLRAAFAAASWRRTSIRTWMPERAGYGIFRQGPAVCRTENLACEILENAGNLVCPAEGDTGASMNLEILPAPEGDDKPLRYLLMFQAVSAVLVNKIDTRAFFDFDDGKATEEIHALNKRPGKALEPSRPGSRSRVIPGTENRGMRHDPGDDIL